MAVADAGAHEREVGDDAALEHVVATVELARLLRRAGQGDRPVGGVAPRHAAVGDLGADAGRGVERGDPGAAGAQALGQRALRDQLDLELAGEELALELLVLTDVRRRHAGDALGLQQDAEAPVVDAAVVRHDRQPGHALVEQRVDQHGRDPAEPEPSDRQGRAVADVRHGLRRGPDHLVQCHADRLPRPTCAATLSRLAPQEEPGRRAGRGRADRAGQLTQDSVSALVGAGFDADPLAPPPAMVTLRAPDQSDPTMSVRVRPLPVD